MYIGLLIYGSIDNQSGGYLYDRMLVDHLRAAGDQVEVISLPERSYLGNLGDNFSLSLRNRLAEMKQYAAYELFCSEAESHPKKGAVLPVSSNYATL